MIDHKVLTFLKVAECESFSMAAEALGLTQPAVSQQIRQLETELGAQLMIRKRGTFTLTPQGTVVLRYARMLLKTYRSIGSVLENMQHQIQHCVVPITLPAMDHPIVDIIAQYSIETPGMKFSMYECNRTQVYDAIRNGTTEWGIVDVAPESEDFSTVSLQREYLMCVLSPDHPLASATAVELDDVLREPTILPLPKYTSTAFLTAELRRMGHQLDQLHIRFETNDISAIKRYVRKNMGISILPENSCAEEVLTGELVVRPIADMRIAFQPFIIYKDEGKMPDTLQEILKRYNRSL